MRLRTSTAFLAATGALATGVHAQSDEPYNIGTIVISGGTTLDEVEVSEEDLALINPTDLQDVFRMEPSVSVGSSLPVSQKVYVDGIEENNLAFTIDGARQNNRIFHHNATTLLDPDILKTVRVDPGVAPADAGPGALGGSVAAETKDVDDLLAPGLSFGGYGRGEYIGNGATTVGNLALYGRTGGFEYLGFVKKADGDNMTDGHGDDIPGSAAAMLSGLGKVAFETETGHRVELSFESVTDDNIRPYRANIGAIIGGRPVPETRNYDLNRRNTVLTYTTTQPTDFWDPKALLAYSVTDLDIDEPDQQIHGTTDSLNGVVQNTFALPMGSVVAGLDFYSDTGDIDYRYLPDRSWDETAEEEARNVGVFAQARLNLTPVARLSFGARGDFQEFTGVDGSTFEDSGASFNISGEVDVTEGITLSAGGSHVWAGVPLAENFIMNPNWLYPDDGLEPTTAENLYLAAEGVFGPVVLDGRMFSTSIDNARTPSYGGGPALSSDVESRGFELGARYDWTNGFVRVAYANIDTEINGNAADSYNGQYLTAPLGEAFVVQVVQQLPEYGLTFGADAEIVPEYDETYLSDSDRKGPPLPGYEVFNAFVEYQPSEMPNVTLRADVTNIFDEENSARATYGQEFDTVEPLREPGRSFNVSAVVRF